MKHISDYAIIDARTDPDRISELEKYVGKIVFSRKKSVAEPISTHSDISVCKISDNEIIVSPDDFDYYENELPGVNIIKGDKIPLGAYPNDVVYNAACFSDTAIHKFTLTDKIALSVIEQKFQKRINVNQGYSKCSICGFESGAAVTDDESIFKKLIDNGYDVLKISKGDVRLTGMNYGFFGGATGTIENYLVLNGSLSFHSDENLIKNFLKKNANLIELSNNEIVDIGSIILLNSCSNSVK